MISQQKFSGECWVVSEGSEKFSRTETHRQGGAGNLEFFESVLTRTKIIACFEHYVISVKYQDRKYKKEVGTMGPGNNRGSARFRSLINWQYMKISRDIIHVTDIQQRTNNAYTRNPTIYGYRQTRPYGIWTNITTHIQKLNPIDGFRSP